MLLVDGGSHMKKAALVICIFALITALTGIPYMVEGISQRGWDGVNYGRIVFPLLIIVISFVKYRKYK